MCVRMRAGHCTRGPAWGCLLGFSGACGSSPSQGRDFTFCGFCVAPVPGPVPFHGRLWLRREGFGQALPSLEEFAEQWGKQIWY